MDPVTAKDIKAAYGQIDLWPDWADGREWRVPIYPKQGYTTPNSGNEPLTPDPIPVITFRIEPAVHVQTHRKVWLAYGYHADLKVLCEVMKR